MRARRTAAVLAGLGLVAGLAVATSPDALAASCPSGYVCFWQDANYSGGKFTTDATINNFKGFEFTNGVTLNDKISSIVNNTAYPLYMFIDADFDNISGFDATCDETVPAHSSRAHVRYNDKYSSEIDNT